MPTPVDVSLTVIRDILCTGAAPCHVAELLLQCKLLTRVMIWNKFIASNCDPENEYKKQKQIHYLIIFIWLDSFFEFLDSMVWFINQTIESRNSKKTYIQEGVNPQTTNTYNWIYSSARCYHSIHSTTNIHGVRHHWWIAITHVPSLVTYCCECERLFDRIFDLYDLVGLRVWGGE